MFQNIAAACRVPAGVSGRILAAILLLSTLLFVAPARAQWSPRVETRTIDRGPADPVMGELSINGVVVMRLRQYVGGYLPEQRVLIAADRIRAAISAGAKPSDFVIDATTDKTSPSIKVQGGVIATATAAEARGVASSPESLVRSWLSALRRALAIPGISVSSDRVLVPLNERRTVTVGGAARGPVEVSVASGAVPVVAAQVDPVTGSISLSGVAPGKDVVTLRREGATTNIVVAVQPYAGRVLAPRPVRVTGALAPSDLVRRYINGTALAALQPLPGATVRTQVRSLSVPSLSSGQSTTISVPVEISGPEMIPVSTTLRIPVRNQPYAPVDTAMLLYSNNPERISRFGTLFVGRLAAGDRATRLLYHHQSKFDRGVEFTVELINDGDTPASVQVIGGPAGPVLDTVWVGYRAASLFLQDLRQNIGGIVEVPARSRVALTTVRLAPGLTISGLAQLRQEGGKPLLVRVAADIPGDPRVATAELAPTPNPWASEASPASFPLSEHIYPQPTKDLKASYRAGERWTFLPVGRHPIPGANGENKLEGNFGVDYNIELTLENPTDAPATAQVVFEPTAGLAGGIFFIDGKPVEIPQANLPAEITLAKYQLSPGTRQIVQVRTLPLSGSNYPIQLTVRP